MAAADRQPLEVGQVLAPRQVAHEDLADVAVVLEGDIITARDDPFIPYKAIESAKLSANVALHVTPSGGHLGFIAGRNGDPDRHWLDWRVVDCHRALNTRQSCNAQLN